MLSLVTRLSDSSESLGGTKLWEPADADLAMTLVMGVIGDDAIAVARAGVEPGVTFLSASSAASEALGTEEASWYSTEEMELEGEPAIGSTMPWRLR